MRADLFVACLGIQANVHLAASAGLAVGRGIQVDSALRTADPNIYVESRVQGKDSDKKSVVRVRLGWILVGFRV